MREDRRRSLEWESMLEMSLGGNRGPGAVGTHSLGLEVDKRGVGCGGRRGYWEKVCQSKVAEGKGT